MCPGQDRISGIQVAGNPVLGGDVLQGWFHLRAPWLDKGAAGAKAASGGRIDRIRRIADERWALNAFIGIHRRGRGEERLRVGMQGGGGDLVGTADLDDLS